MKYLEFIINLGNGLTIYDPNMTERLHKNIFLDALVHKVIDGDVSIASPDWHRNILKERKEKIINGKTEFISLSELKRRRDL